MKPKRCNRHEIFRAAETAIGKQPQRPSRLDTVSGDTEYRNTAGLQEEGRFTPQPEGFSHLGQVLLALELPRRHLLMLLRRVLLVVEAWRRHLLQGGGR